MPKEKMAELKIKIPTRWLKFISEYYEITGINHDEDQRSNVMSIIYTFIEDLDAKDRIRLVEKYHLSDIYEIPPGVWKEAAGIPRTVKPVPDPWENIACLVSHLLVNNPKFKESYSRYREEAIIKTLEELTPEEKTEIKAAILSARDHA